MSKCSTLSTCCNGFTLSSPKNLSFPPCTNLSLDVSGNRFAIFFFRYTFDIENTGPLPATNAVIHVTFIGIPILILSPGWVFSGNTATHNLGTLPVGFSATNSFPLTFAAAAPSAVFATLTSDTPGCSPLNQLGFATSVGSPPTLPGLSVNDLATINAILGQSTITSADMATIIAILQTQPEVSATDIATLNHSLAEST